METDNAQSTQVPANGTPEVPGNTAQANPLPGVQERINELTAKYHAAQEASQQQAAITQGLMEQNRQLMEKLTERANTHTEVPLPEGVDPTLVDIISQRVQAPLMATIQKLEKTLAATVGGVSANQEQMAVQQAIAGESPAVQRQVMNLFTEAKQKGLSGWTPQNLVWMARGMIGAPTPPARAGAPDMMSPGAGTPAVSHQPGVKRKSDEEVAKMSRDQRVAYYDSLVGDSEVQY